MEAKLGVGELAGCLCKHPMVGGSNSRYWGADQGLGSKVNSPIPSLQVGKFNVDRYLGKFRPFLSILKLGL